MVLQDLLSAPVNYDDLGSKAKEVYNFAKTAAILADYGFDCQWIHNDSHGADMSARHLSGVNFDIQLKGRPTIAKKYMGKNIWIAYIDREHNEFCMYNHDEAVEIFESAGKAETKSWEVGGQYSFSQTKKPSIFEEISIRLKIK